MLPAFSAVGTSHTPLPYAWRGSLYTALQFVFSVPRWAVFKLRYDFDVFPPQFPLLDGVVFRENPCLGRFRRKERSGDHSLVHAAKNLQRTNAVTIPGEHQQFSKIVSGSSSEVEDQSVCNNLILKGDHGWIVVRQAFDPFLGRTCQWPDEYLRQEQVDFMVFAQKLRVFADELLLRVCVANRYG